jgi:hypothetical protein
MACFLKLTCQLKPGTRFASLQHDPENPLHSCLPSSTSVGHNSYGRSRRHRALEDTQKYCVNFKEPAQKIGPIPLVSGGRVAAAQSIRYTSFARLQKAKSLDDVFLATKPTQLAFSRTTSFAFLSSLIPRKTGCRRRSSRVHSVNFIWQTITGLTQCQRSISAAVNP